MSRLEISDGTIELVGKYGSTWFGKTKKSSLSITSFVEETGTIQTTYIPKDVVASLLPHLVSLMLECIKPEEQKSDKS